jgi:hypothetical protein
MMYSMATRKLEYHPNLRRHDLIKSVMNSRSDITAEGRLKRMWLRMRTAALNMAGWYLEKTKAPARLIEFEFVDPASDQTVYLYTSTGYSVLCVGERRFYFDRVSGRFDGVSAPSGFVPDWAELGD